METIAIKFQYRVYNDLSDSFEKGYVFFTSNWYGPIPREDEKIYINDIRYVVESVVYSILMAPNGIRPPDVIHPSILIILKGNHGR